MPDFPRSSAQTANGGTPNGRRTAGIRTRQRLAGTDRGEAGLARGAGRDVLRAHRPPRPAAQLVPPPDARPRDGAGARRRGRRHARRQARRSARAARAHQGHADDRGRSDDHGVGRVREQGAGAEFRRRRAGLERRGGHARQDQRAGVRHGWLLRKLPRSARTQPLEHRQDARRIERRRGSGCRGLPVPRGDRERRGRLAPHTRQLLWHIHHQADPGSRIRLHRTGRASDAEHLLAARPVDADGTGRCNTPAGIGGIRPS